MAATLTDTGELTYVSFGIEKVESTPDGDLMVYGRATDGSVDHDQQIVDPVFSSKAIAEWLSTGGNVRVQHNPQRDPAGIGMEASTDADGATWVKSLIVEPIAKKLVSKGVLRAYSVGIANPTIDRDVTGKARGGIIKSGKIVEISLVDRPANAQCGFQLVKSAGEDGHAEYAGEVFGSQEAISKALAGDTLTKDVAGTIEDISAFSVPDNFNIDFTPDDLMRVMQEKIVKRHYDELAATAIAEAENEILGKAVEQGVPGITKRNVSTAERHSLAASGNALPDGSYPIKNTGDLHNAAHLARTGHGNSEAAGRLVARRARELGVPNPMTDSDDTPKVLKDAPPEIKEATPDIIKDPDEVDGEDGHGGDEGGPTPGDNVPPKPKKGAAESLDGGGGKAAKKPKKGKLPPWVKSPDDDGDADDAPKVCKEEHVHTEKCSGTPKTASGAKEAADMDEAPAASTTLLEYPAKPHMKMAEAAMMRFKTIGIDTDMGMLHDFTCAAFHPEEVAKYYPLADFGTLIDDEVWQRKALAAATGKSIAEAMEAQQAWQAAIVLKNADPGELNSYRVEMYKAFRDANPGVSSFPTPGAMSPAGYSRPNITAGHATLSSGYGGPNSAQVPSGSPNAHHFDRAPLGSGQASPSPSFMKASFEYPQDQGVPTSLSYAQMEKDKARRALSMMHDHLLHMFPQACPMIEQDAYRQEPARGGGLNLPVGIGKAAEVDLSDGGEVLSDVYKYIRKLERKVRLGEITEDQARTKLSKRTAQRYAMDLQQQVQKGMTSISEVRRALGIEPEVITKAAAPEPDINKGLTPDLMKTMMSEILEPLQVKITALEEKNADYESRIEAQNTEIDTYRQRLQVNDQRWDALANQPDPSTAAFAGLALNPANTTKNAPAGIVKQAQHHERVQGMMIRQLERTWRTSENPAEREAAYNALVQYRGHVSPE